MKKLIYMFVFALLCIASFSACGDDNDETASFSETAAKAATGVYEGTYTRTLDGSSTATEETGQGTMTITAQSDYVAMFSYSCSTLGINHESIANISHSNNGFAFSNNLKTNGLGSVFLGRIDDNKNVEAHLKTFIVSGRSSKTYNVVFKGQKKQ